MAVVFQTALQSANNGHPKAPQVRTLGGPGATILTRNHVAATRDPVIDEVVRRCFGAEPAVVVIDSGILGWSALRAPEDPS